MKPKVVMGRRGQKSIVTHLEYHCKNEETGCNYLVESTTMTSMEMKPLREDGSLVKL